MSTATATKVKYPDSVSVRVKVAYKQWQVGTLLELGTGEAFERRKQAPGVFEPEGANRESFLAFEKAALGK